MNILFLCTFKVTKNASGGISRVTGNLSNLFSEKGHCCSLAYYNDVPGENDGMFKTISKLSRENEVSVLNALASENDIFIVQIQMNKENVYLLPILDSLRRKHGIRIVYCNHSVPFAEAAGFNGDYLKHLLFHSSKQLKKRIMDILWCCIVILFPEYAVKRMARRSQQVTNHVDMTVLLSESFIPLFRKYVNCTDSQIAAVGNCFTFSDMLPFDQLDKKEKIVLVVSNMTEHAKRISTILKIWKTVSEKEHSKGWKLVLVGDGEDLDYYRRKANSMKLANCIFQGRQDPLPYYRKSSILMFASAFEGFGMVMIEAQQMGCVPVSFESSTSVHDIINNGENGIIVPLFDNETFAERLYELMSNPQKLLFMARNCIESDNRFSGASIYSKWEKIFKLIQQTEL
ncbi:MAG: glycosyltransferase [Salinivirgaceae bacterium]|nr:glycosyltransferase [Salinivirgaceae bacterium]